MLTSSIMITEVPFISFPVASLEEKFATKSSVMFIGILHLLWSVLPLWSNVAAMPESAVSMAFG